MISYCSGNSRKTDGSLFYSELFLTYRPMLATCEGTCALHGFTEQQKTQVNDTKVHLAFSQYVKLHWTDHASALLKKGQSRLDRTGEEGQLGPGTPPWPRGGWWWRSCLLWWTTSARTPSQHWAAPSAPHWSTLQLWDCPTSCGL